MLAQRTTAKEQDRRIICAVMPQEIVTQNGAVAVENHLNMIFPAKNRPRVTLKALAAFLSSAAADRVIRCISGSVALSASELEAMPLPSIDDLTAALGEPDPDLAVRRLYGIADVAAANTAARPDPRASEDHLPGRHARSELSHPGDGGSSGIHRSLHRDS